MAIVESEKFIEIVKSVCNQFSVDDLKKEQYEMLKSMLGKRDCMAILPTGYGKSLPYQIFLPIVRALRKSGNTQLEFDVEDRIIVCCPLVALMQDQAQRLQSVSGLHAVYKGGSQETDERIKKGEFDILFASPESLVGDSRLRSQLQHLKVGTVVIDEFHTISTWGGDEDSDDYQAFRKWFRHIGELRSLFPSASVLALSATCTKKIRKRVLKVLCLNESETTIISISPNKSNIKVVVKKVDNDVESAMYWLIEALGTLKETFPRTLIYANSISDVSKLYNYVVGEIVHCSKLVDMFHSETPEEKKEYIVAGLREKDSEKRIVFATSALGMGIDVVDCNSVVLYGPPRTLVDLIQLIGRVGRNGGKSTALILYNSYNVRNVDKDIKSLISCKTCRRIELMSSFVSDTELKELSKESNIHTCCDICAEVCKCTQCSILDLEKLFSNVCINDYSDSDTIEYEYQQFDDSDNAFDNLSDNEIFGMLDISEDAEVEL